MGQADRRGHGGQRRDEDVPDVQPDVSRVLVCWQPRGSVSTKVGHIEPVSRYPIILCEEAPRHETRLFLQTETP